MFSSKIWSRFNIAKNIFHFRITISSIFFIDRYVMGFAMLMDLLDRGADVAYCRIPKYRFFKAIS